MTIKNVELAKGRGLDALLGFSSQKRNYNF